MERFHYTGNVFINRFYSIPLKLNKTRKNMARILSFFKFYVHRKRKTTLNDNLVSISLPHGKRTSYIWNTCPY